MSKKGRGIRFRAGEQKTTATGPGKNTIFLYEYYRFKVYGEFNIGSKGSTM
ncbi:uncharacterized protein G2W53_040590 [Senna tora]|uniref:Uncharacterized protein n=1 Tax=Senna tora TaxID=362788 RepID=A0A834SQ37_9FABA|nr:uncharacterized protein G2W53_040590 [Senna tora]